MATVPEARPQPEEIWRYNNGAVILHWLTVVLLLTQVWVGWTFSDMERGPERMEVFTWHKTLGVLILLITLVRIAWRLMHRPPPYPDEMPAWERFAGTWNHRAFYLLLLALPITGLAAVSGDGPTTALIGGIPFPDIPGASEDFEFGDVHENLVTITIVLILLHAGAALKHQFIDSRRGTGRAAGRMPPFTPRDDSPVEPKQ